MIACQLVLGWAIMVAHSVQAQFGLATPAPCITHDQCGQDEFCKELDPTKPLLPGVCEDCDELWDCPGSSVNGNQNSCEYQGQTGGGAFALIRSKIHRPSIVAEHGPAALARYLRDQQSDGCPSRCNGICAERTNPRKCSYEAGTFDQLLCPNRPPPPSPPPSPPPMGEISEDQPVNESPSQPNQEGLGSAPTQPTGSNRMPTRPLAQPPTQSFGGSPTRPFGGSPTRPFGGSPTPPFTFGGSPTPPSVAGADTPQSAGDTSESTDNDDEMEVLSMKGATLYSVAAILIVSLIACAVLIGVCLLRCKNRNARTSSSSARSQHNGSLSGRPSNAYASGSMKQNPAYGGGYLEVGSTK